MAENKTAKHEPTQLSITLLWEWLGITRGDIESKNRAVMSALREWLCSVGYSAPEFLTSQGKILEFNPNGTGPPAEPHSNLEILITPEPGCESAACAAQKQLNDMATNGTTGILTERATSLVGAIQNSSTHTTTVNVYRAASFCYL